MLHRNGFAQEQRAAGAEELFAHHHHHHHHQNILYLCSCQMQVAGPELGQMLQGQIQRAWAEQGSSQAVLCAVPAFWSSGAAGEADSAGSTKTLICFNTRSPIQGKLRPGLCCSSYWGQGPPGQAECTGDIHSFPFASPREGGFLPPLVL